MNDKLAGRAKEKAEGEKRLANRLSNNAPVRRHVLFVGEGEVGDQARGLQEKFCNGPSIRVLIFLVYVVDCCTKFQSTPSLMILLLGDSSPLRSRLLHPLTQLTSALNSASTRPSEVVVVKRRGEGLRLPGFSRLFRLRKTLIGQDVQSQDAAAEQR